MYDVIIAGAGPAGLKLAKSLEDELDLAVLEKNNSTGKKVCSGLVSKNLDRFVKMEKDWVEHTVRGADVHFPYSNLKLRKPGTAAYVINRGKFDRSLEKNLETGIDFGERVTGLKVESDGVKVKTTKGIKRCKILVGCDGAGSVVRRHFGQEPDGILNGIVVYRNESSTSDTVDLWFDRKVLSDGFFWKIPRGKKTEYGMWGKRANISDLKSFFKIRDCSPEAAPIPIGIIKTSFERTLLLGDAACQVKPWSGGGIIWSFAAAEIAAEKILRALELESPEILNEYDREWKEEFGGILSKAMFMRKLYRFTPDRLTGIIINLYKKFGHPNNLDMDFVKERVIQQS